MAELVAIASAGLGAISAISGGQQQAAALRQQAAANERNAAQARINAGVALNTSEAEAQRTQQQTRRRGAGAFNQAAASGADPAFGSPLDLMADIAAEGALDAQIQRFKGANQARGFLVQSDQFETQAGYDRDAAGQAATAGYIRAGSAVLGGLASYNQLKAK